MPSLLTEVLARYLPKQAIHTLKHTLDKQSTREELEMELKSFFTQKSLPLSEIDKRMLIVSILREWTDRGDPETQLLVRSVVWPLEKQILRKFILLNT